MTIQCLPGAATPRYFGNSSSPSRTASPCCPDRPSAILARRSWKSQSIVSACGLLHMEGHLRWRGLVSCPWRPRWAPATLPRRLATRRGAGDSEEAPFLLFFSFLRGTRPVGLGPPRVPELIRLARPLTHLCPSVRAPWVPASHVCLSSSDLPPHTPPRPVGPRSVSLSAAHVPFAHPHRPPPAAAALANLPP